MTHDHDEAFALADRVAVMHAGRLEQTGSPRDVWTHPATEFVARFVGWNLSTALGDDLVAIRPDALQLASDGRWHGHVVSRSFRRDHQRLQVALDPRTATSWTSRFRTTPSSRTSARSFA